MASKNRLQELRIPRNGTAPARHRSLAGGTVVGDYVDGATGDRVLHVKVVAHAQDKPRKTAAAARGGRGRHITATHLSESADSPGTPFVGKVATDDGEAV